MSAGLWGGAGRTPAVFHVPASGQAQDIVRLLSGAAELGRPVGDSSVVEWRWRTKRAGALQLCLLRAPRVFQVKSKAQGEAVLKTLSRDGLLLWLALLRYAHQEGYAGSFDLCLDQLTRASRWERASRRRGRPAVEGDVARVLQLMGALSMTWDHNGLSAASPLVALPHGTGVVSLPQAVAPTRRRRRYVRVPTGLLEARPEVLGLGILLLFQYANGRRDVFASRNLRLTMGKLWEWAGVRAGRGTERRRWLEACSVLDRRLGELQRFGIVDKWRLADGGPSAVGKITPPWWWIRAEEGTIQINTVNLAGLPRTGQQLSTWRREKGLSQQALAAILGVSQASVSRGERAPRVPIRWRERLLDHRRRHS